MIAPFTGPPTPSAENGVLLEPRRRKVFCSGRNMELEDSEKEIDSMRYRRRRNTAGRLVAGLILIALGLAFTLDNLGILGVEFDNIWKFWPVFLIVIGTAKLFRLEERAAGLWMVGIGVWLQVVALGLWGMDWDTSWPVLLILIGAIMVTLTLLERMGWVAPREGCSAPEGGQHAEG